MKTIKSDRLLRLGRCDLLVAGSSPAGGVLLEVEHEAKNVDGMDKVFFMHVDHRLEATGHSEVW